MKQQQKYKYPERGEIKRYAESSSWNTIDTFFYFLWKL